MKILYIGSTSACLEIENQNPYYTPETYTVYLDNQEVLTGDTNVFSLFDLRRDTEYSVIVRFSSEKEETVRFRTAAETCCINVRDFGAVGDGVTEDTHAIQSAICLMPEGGRLYFPAGTYWTLPLTLKSHITLELSENAVILGMTERDRYPIIPGFVKDMETGEDIPFGGFEGNEVPAYQALLYASYAKDITVVGKGRIDGNGQNGDWWGDFQSFPAARPRVFFCNRTKNVVFHGITLANSPSWHMHPFFSKNISFLDCAFSAPKDSPNTDAIDPESCDGVNIIGCRFSVGDDCIAVKSGKIGMARKYRTPADHHTIRNCLMEFGHGGVTLGSEAAAGIRNLSVTQCYFHATDRGLRIKSRRGRGKDSFITNVLFDNIRMDRVLTPLVINMWYNCVDPDRFTEYVWSREPLPVDDRTPKLGAFTFRNMECTNAEVAACYIDGLPESPIDEVVLENIRISFAKDAKPGIPAMQNFAKERCCLGLYLDNVKHIRIQNVSLQGVAGDKLIVDHCEDIVTEGLEEGE
ncbi:MAG: glycoside hydrolase family 28 protein [Clostridiales bacterium]|nr:glycoside hydrolase family 28 protein [Clostridiales bacterium]